MPASRLYLLFQQHPLISTDSRSVAKNSLFFALKGEHFNGNTFAAAALESGAAYAIIDEEEYAGDERCILVADVLSALQDLAREHRENLDIPVIGMTGSNGKTTTKELLAAVLRQKFSTFATAGNLNNHIGVPLSVLSISAAHEMAVIEMGANHQKEIELLCSICRPTHGLITNVGKAHLEGFGGFEGVKKAKGELYAWIAESGGTAFVNFDNTALMEMLEKNGVKKAVYYGTTNDSRVQARLVKSSPYLKIEWWKTGTPETVHDIHSHLTGAYNAENMLAAVCIGDFFGIEGQQIDLGISGYHPSNNRSQIMQTENNTLICDFYNANPSSMSAALENFARIDARKKAIILADMLELGIESPGEHDEVIRHALEVPNDLCIFVGPDFFRFRDEREGEYFENTAGALAWLQKNPLKEHSILLKGSRGMALEKLIPAL
ncbi:MAG: UDP-N-acetylmuramoyl-tripeptide--D-alanyl-D-alanine ligase [Mucilaginibacter polytrichastri]|nr:UDP-N-acetylmuramoyl-tripeptide--D-alanyl-D-alanine ligase [Mucilaginibacter polytrichastri]